MVNVVNLVSSDHQVFEVTEAVARVSETVSNLIDDIDDVDADTAVEVPLANVTGATLARVIEYVKYHIEPTGTAAEGRAWDVDFLNVDQPVLFDTILAANYLNIRGLLDVSCQAVADMMKGKTTEEIRTTFGIKNDFTPEEEDEVRQENQWAFE